MYNYIASTVEIAQEIRSAQTPGAILSSETNLLATSAHLPPCAQPQQGRIRQRPDDVRNEVERLHTILALFLAVEKILVSVQAWCAVPSSAHGCQWAIYY
jgi:hypothetical protein